MAGFHLLELGFVGVPEETLLRGVGRQPVRVPVRTALITSEGRNILFDTGCGDGGMNGSMPMWCSDTENLPRQLANHGLAINDIDTVVLSHLHADHAGGAAMFPHAEFWVPQEDWENAPLPIESSHVRQVPVGGDFDLCREVRILTLPGHTPNLLRLAVRTEGRTLLIPSDAVYAPVNMGPPVRLPGACLDAISYRRSIHKVRSLQRQMRADLVFFHWPYSPENQC